MSSAARREYDRKRYAENRDARRAATLANYHAKRDTYIKQKLGYRNANRAEINLAQKTGLPVPTCRRLLAAEKVTSPGNQVQPPDGGAA